MSEEWEDTLHTLANESGDLYRPSGRLRRSKSISRANVIAAFQQAFEMIGDIPRLAVWADANPTDFYKLYGRLLPSSNTSELDAPQEIIVRHALPPPLYLPSANASQRDSTQLPTTDDLFAVPSANAAVGDKCSPPAGREDGSDDK